MAWVRKRRILALVLAGVALVAVTVVILSGMMPLRPDWQLKEAVFASDMEAARSALASGANPNFTLYDEKRYGGVPLLSEAVSRSSLPMVRLLLESGANVNAADRAGITPLNTAVGMDAVPDQISRIELLIAAGAKVDAVNRSGDTPLALAVRLGRTDIVKVLLSHGADPNLAPMKDGFAPLHWCERITDKTTARCMAEMLMAAGADPDKQQGTIGSPRAFWRAWHRADLVQLPRLDGGAAGGE